MICIDCRIGGASLARAMAPDTPDGVREYYRADAALLHQKCKGGTHCDCHHWVKSSAIQDAHRNR